MSAARGPRRERQVRDQLLERDWQVVRAAGSLGCADLVALKAGELPRLVEVKSTANGPYERFGPVARNDLKQRAEWAGATAWLACGHHGASSGGSLHTNGPPDERTEGVVTAIEWTDQTWNPTTGCSKVSPGCAHCYAETLSLRFGWSKKPWTPENAAENVVLHPERLTKPLRWRKPRMVFVNSMSDLFHELIPFSFVEEVFAVMERTPRHTYQVLTKRPERAREYLAARYDVGLPNVWIGTSVENQRWADERVPILLDTPAAVRFLSCEPLLGPVTFRWSPWAPLRGLHWIIVGGESGPKHRPMAPEWVRELRDHSTEAGIAFFFKQWGGRTPKSNGRELDGREWSQYPECTT